MLNHTSQCSQRMQVLVCVLVSRIAMATKQAEIQNYLPQIVLDKLVEYRQIHKLQSTSQAIVVALAEFFSIEVLQLNLISSSNKCIADRVGQLEIVVNQLVKQLAALEQENSSLSQLVDYSTTNPQVEPLRPLERVQLTEPVSASLLPVEGDSHSDSHSDLLCPTATSSQSQPSLYIEHLEQIQTTIASENWVDGINTNDLVARLKTNPTTLKKYLRELKQIQWAVKRDPDGLGWIYDSLLERYYPVQINAADNASTGIFTPSDINVPELLRTYSTLGTNSVPHLNLIGSERLECKGGLTQSQLSRLTGIPINTLQRWKHLTDCSERIRRRTEGAFAYSYSKQNRQFYPIGSSSV